MAADAYKLDVDYSITPEALFYKAFQLSDQTREARISLHNSLEVTTQQLRHHLYSVSNLSSEENNIWIRVHTETVGKIHQEGRFLSQRRGVTSEDTESGEDTAKVELRPQDLVCIFELRQRIGPKRAVILRKASKRTFHYLVMTRVFILPGVKYLYYPYHSTLFQPIKFRARHSKYGSAYVKEVPISETAWLSLLSLLDIDDSVPDDTDLDPTCGVIFRTPKKKKTLCSAPRQHSETCEKRESSETEDM